MNELIEINALSESGVVTEKGVVIPDGWTKEQSITLFHYLSGVSEITRLGRGDILNTIDDRWGEEYTQLYEESGKSHATLNKYKWVSSRIPIFRRRKNLTYTHYEIIAGIKDEKKEDYWIKRVSEEGISTRSLEDLIEKDKPKIEVMQPEKKEVEDTQVYTPKQINMKMSRLAILEGEYAELKLKYKELEKENKDLKLKLVDKKQKDNEDNAKFQVEARKYKEIWDKYFKMITGATAEAKMSGKFKGGVKSIYDQGISLDLFEHRLLWLYNHRTTTDFHLKPYLKILTINNIASKWDVLGALMVTIDRTETMKMDYSSFKQIKNGGGK
jgi:hypothetical protein